MPHAWSFARVSSSQQSRRGGGLQRQGSDSDAAAREWCAAHGCTYVDSFRFVGSAYQGRHMAEGAPLQAWLEQAIAGSLGESPVLLVEDVDRFTRQAGHVALGPLLTRVFPAGVRIVTLKDGTVYSQEAFERDDRLLGDLLDEIRSAHRYSTRLSRRMTAAWDQARARIEAGVPVRAGVIAPFWISAESGGWILNSQAPLARRIFGRALDVGAVTIARELNRDRIPALARRGPSTRPWTAAGIMSHLRNPAAHGAVCLRRGGTPALIRDDYFPPLITREQFEAIQARIEERKRDPGSRGRRDVTRWIGQRITRCACGWSVCSTTSSGGGGTRIPYLQCARRRNEADVCRAPSYNLTVATAHLLTRLQPAQLESLVEDGGDRQTAIRDAIEARDGAAALLLTARRELENATRALKVAIKAGAPVDVFLAAHGEADEAVALHHEAHRAAIRRLAALQQSPSVEQLQAPVLNMLLSFADGADTSEQRAAVNRGLQRLGVRIILARDELAMGLSIADGAVDWQPVDPAQLDYLARGRAGIRSEAWMGDLAVIDRDEVKVYMEAEWLDGFPTADVLGREDGL